MIDWVRELTRPTCADDFLAASKAMAKEGNELLREIRQARGLAGGPSGNNMPKPSLPIAPTPCAKCAAYEREIAALRQELAALYDIAALRQECNVTAVTRNESVTDERNVTRNVTDENVTRNANVTDTVTRNESVTDDCNVTPVTDDSVTRNVTPVMRALAESLENSKMAAAARVLATANAERQRAYRERKRKGKS